MLTAVLVTLLLQTRFQSPSCVAGEGWEFVVRSRDLGKSPHWSQANDNPPLAARAAIRAARAVLSRMACKDPDHWELAAVALRPVAGESDTWMYVVTFVEPFAPPRGSVAGSALRRSVDIPVLLDGNALTPSVGPWPPKR